LTRAEHLAWAKQRALEELDRGDSLNAITSMLSDLGKHEELQKSRAVGVMSMVALDARDDRRVRHWIEGFA
jgi:hypothetical protein